MPVGPLVDTHLHLWDPGALRYPWLDQNELLNRPHLLSDYRRATASQPVEAMVFVQCEADFAQFEQEAAWVVEQARQEPRIRGLVAWAPLEKGRAVTEDLHRLSRYPLLRGIRRIIQFEPDLDFCLRPEFIEGVRTLRDFGLSFDICIDHRHMLNVCKFVQAVPEVPMILDHIGKPDIRSGLRQPWGDQMRTLASFPNVVCKISGVATEADHKRWTPEELKPYIDTAIDAFGFDRIMFGGDWPVSTQAIGYDQWIRVLDDIFAGVREADQRKFWHDNAMRVYRLSTP
jgi:L-fuconolactonase